MFGSVGSFFYKHLLGVTPLEPGYSRLRVRPAVVSHPNLTHAAGTVATPLGACVVAWATNASCAGTRSPVYELKVTVPVGASALVTVPLSIKPHNATGTSRPGPSTRDRDRGPALTARISESGRAVWSAGKYTAGVAGITSAALGAAGDGVEFSIGSGQYHFALLTM